MMEGLAFLPDEDIINSIRLLRMLDPNEPPECTDLHDYFDRTNISGTPLTVASCMIHIDAGNIGGFL
jgi:hypothetical protein